MIDQSFLCECFGCKGLWVFPLPIADIQKPYEKFDDDNSIGGLDGNRCLVSYDIKAENFEVRKEQVPEELANSFLYENEFCYGSYQVHSVDETSNCYELVPVIPKLHIKIAQQRTVQREVMKYALSFCVIVLCIV